MNASFLQGLIFGIALMFAFDIGCYVANPRLKRAIKAMMKKRDEDEFGDEQDDDDEG